MIPLTEPVHFLLVDDLEENLLSLEALLRRDGLVLLKARSGDEALELLLRYDVALALIDVRMPGLERLRTGRVDARRRAHPPRADHVRHGRRRRPAAALSRI